MGSDLCRGEGLGRLERIPVGECEIFLAEVFQVFGQGCGEGALEVRAFEFDAGSVQCVSGEEELGGVAGSPAVLDEVKIECVVGSVKLVADDGVFEPLGVEADLVGASGVRGGAHEGVVVLGVEWGEEGYGCFGVGGVCDAVFDGDGAGGVALDGFINEDGFGHCAVDEGEIGFLDLAVFEGGLAVAGGGGVLGDEEDSAGFAVEAADEVEFCLFFPFFGGADEAGPRAVFGGVADDVSGFVEGDEVGVFLDDPAGEFVFGDEWDLFWHWVLGGVVFVETKKPAR